MSGVVFSAGVVGPLPVRGAVAVLVEALASAGFALAAATTGYTTAAPVQGVPAVAPLFAIVDTSRVARTPHPQGYLVAAEKIGIAPSKCVVIEDEAVGVVAARRAGMSAIGLLGTATKEALTAAGANLVVGSLTELSPAVIQKLPPPSKKFPYIPYSLGHRGARSHAPENTLLSFRRALELGVDRVECDLRLTKDHNVVVCHDATIDRTSNGRGYIKNLTLKELLEYDFGMGEKIPTLDQLLQLVKPSGKILHIELKESGVEQSMVHSIHKHGMCNQVLVISFSVDLLAHTHHIDTTLRLGVLCQGPPRVVEAQAVGAHEIGCFHNELGADDAQHVHSAGMLLHCFNPDDPLTVERAVALGVDGIGSNKPDMLVKALSALS
eukprot:TRINITY_DN27156_c0_g1_i1.p1 TRINITY_DN27156_c0_g1~~TRINITY_DN27156_c0_g1_i1.p1  ORF type:complete len:381 (-),score=91.38 TRINITY_DN27156_c0_g1_i1:108-1250(-)